MDPSDSSNYIHYIHPIQHISNFASLHLPEKIQIQETQMATLDVLPTPRQHPHPHQPNPSLPRPGESEREAGANDGGYDDTENDNANNTLLAPPEQRIKARTPPPAYASLSPRPGSLDLGPAEVPSTPPPPLLASGSGSTSPTPSHWQSSASSSSSQQTWPNGYPYAYSDTPYFPSSTSQPHTHPEFGPTPLTSGHPLLAVPHAYIGAPGAADRRARWRFVGSMFCAVVLLMGVSGLVGLGLVGEWGGGGMGSPSRGPVCWGFGVGC